MSKISKTKNEIQQLEEENRLMEERLRMMREMMALEKQKRDASSNSSWTTRMAKQEVKKKQEPNKQPASKSPSQASLSTQAKQPTLKSSTSVSTKISSSTAPKLSSSTSSSPPKNNRDVAARETEQINTGGVFDEDASHQSFLGALEEWRKGGESATKTTNNPKKPLSSSTTSTSSLSSSSSTSSVPKFNTNSNINNNLDEGSSGAANSGDFNEEESHQSFLEALQEWRSGGKDGNTSAQKSARPSTAHISTATETSTQSLAPEEVHTLKLNENSSWGAAISENITSIPSSSYFANM